MKILRKFWAATQPSEEWAATIRGTMKAMFYIIIGFEALPRIMASIEARDGNTDFPPMVWLVWVIVIATNEVLPPFRRYYRSLKQAADAKAKRA